MKSFRTSILFQHNWWNANRDCRSKGMNLMSIETEEEGEAIAAELSES